MKVAFLAVIAVVLRLHGSGTADLLPFTSLPDVIEAAFVPFEAQLQAFLEKAVNMTCNDFKFDAGNAQVQGYPFYGNGTIEFRCQGTEVIKCHGYLTAFENRTANLHFVCLQPPISQDFKV